MARKKTGGDFTAFDIVYEDGSRSSNRRIANDALAERSDDAAIRAILEAQDRKVTALSGRPRGQIKSVTRSAGR
jgi:hypothetical protein